MKPFKFYSDNSTGWLAVKRDLSIELGIMGQISVDSFQRGDTVYLHEGHDYSLFEAAYTARFYCRPDIMNVSGIDKNVRYYPQFQRSMTEQFFYNNILGSV